MKKSVKKAGLVLLVVLAVFVYGFPLVTMLMGKQFKIPVHQPAEKIRCIELIDTSGQSEAVLKVLHGNEAKAFLDAFLSLKAGKYVNDPPTKFGILTVKIYYQDGAVDFIGSDMNAYFLPSGEEAGAGWYYVGRKEMLGLFELYVDRNLLPNPDAVLD